MTTTTTYKREVFYFLRFLAKTGNREANKQVGTRGLYFNMGDVVLKTPSFYTVITEIKCED